MFFLLFFFLEAKLLGPISMDILFVLQGTRTIKQIQKNMVYICFQKKENEDAYCFFHKLNIVKQRHTALRALLTPHHHLQLHNINGKSYDEIEGQVARFKSTIAYPKDNNKTELVLILHQFALIKMIPI